MPKGIIRNPAAVIGIEVPLSMCAILALCTSAADFLDTIFMAAACPVMACFASLTLPVAPLPKVLPSCHGPTCVFRLDLAETMEVVEMAEFRLELFCPPFTTAERRLLSGIGSAGGGTGVFLLPSGRKES
jgi:hypothetical protein